MTKVDQFPRRIPVLVVYLHPFRVIESEESGRWECDIDQINHYAWDYVKLHALVGGVDVGLAPPYHLAIGFDGALALPPIPELRDPVKAIQFFNKCLAALLIGGIYCEAVDLDSLQTGSILDWKYIRVSDVGSSFASSFHHTLRMRNTSPSESITLLSPKRTSYYDLHQAMSQGMEIINAVPNLSPDFLLRGVTGLARMDYSAGLSNLWIVVEQLIEHLWQKNVIAVLATGKDKIEGQKEQLSDARTWSIANRLELLFQKAIITPTVMRSLSQARKVRNKLVHDGSQPNGETTLNLYRAVLELVELVARKPFKLSELNIQDHSVSNPFDKPVGPITNVKYWMAIPKLPNEEEIEREEALVRRQKSSNSIDASNA